MNNNTARCLVNAFACNARVEGMKAANMQRAALGQSMAYTDDDFAAEAGPLERRVCASADKRR